MAAFRERLRQFREAGIRPSPDDYAFARELLDNDRLYELFAAQEPRDVLHGVRTARWLVRRHHTDRDLLLAALLHDVGKGAQRTRDRVAWVLAQTARIETVAAKANSRFELRRALDRTARHAHTGAVILREAGAPERVVELTRLHHVRTTQNGMLTLLQAADAAS